MFKDIAAVIFLLLFAMAFVYAYNEPTRVMRIKAICKDYDGTWREFEEFGNTKIKVFMSSVEIHNPGFVGEIKNTQLVLSFPRQWCKIIYTSKA